MHTTGDGLVANQDEQAYSRQPPTEPEIRNLLRQIFVSRAGHCAFTPAETVTAFQTLINRIDTGHWHFDTGSLNADAAALGPDFNIFESGGQSSPRLRRSPTSDRRPSYGLSTSRV